MNVLGSENFSLIADSPGGIQKLRAMILQLAVTGKLVPHSSKEAPARDIIMAIQEEKTNNSQKKSFRPSSSRENDVRFDLPLGWELVDLGDLALLVTDGTHHTPTYVPSGIPFLSIKDISSGKLDFSNTKFITEDEHNEINSRCNPQENDILLCRIGTLGKPVLVDVKTPFSIFVSVGLIKMPRSVQISRWVKLALSAPFLLEQYENIKAGGSHTNKLNLVDIPRLKIPLPPILEQKRIIAKVDELMGLCDLAERQDADAEAIHARLVQGLLSALLASGSDQEVFDSWARINNNFDMLFSTEDSIVHFKSSLIQLATMGKLGTQRENDEPASSLIKQIRARKTKLIDAGQLPKEKSLSDITETELPFKLPSRWAWARIGDLALKTDYGISEKTFEMLEGVPVLKMGDIQNGSVILGGQKKTSVESVPTELYLKPNDLLYNRTNSAELVGKTGLFEGPVDKYTFASYLIRIRVAEDLVIPQYLNLAMNSPSFRETQINPQLKQQCGQANVNGTIMRNMLVPLPPTDEQRRIVVRIERLLALCNELEKLLQETSAFKETLSKALIGKRFDISNGAQKVAEKNAVEDEDSEVLCI
ncbi:MAG: restriction endonuclease subunit S [Candidatus Melainabacteria bacterium]|nr:restriction endonuclease subunit S [Candidatus Melainabacteria bacterium]